MTIDPSIAYHLRELEIARDPNSRYYSMPEFYRNDQAILDIGCGVGQIFAATHDLHAKLLVGLDIDFKCLTYGASHFGHISFVNGTAERLPFHDRLFDIVVSRVSLPYTNMPQTLAEVERVLRRNGRVWFVLHSFSMVRKALVASLQRFSAKDVVYRSYVILDGMFFAIFGRQFSFLWTGKYESFQTISGMKRAMSKAGFIDIWVGKKGRHLICTARKRA